MKRARTFRSLIMALLGIGALAARAQSPNRQVALIAGRQNELIVMSTDGQQIARLTADGRAKSALAWLPDGRHLSYRVALDRANSISHLVIAGLDGSMMKEVPLPPPDDGFRSDDVFTWISDRVVRVERSANPRNCGIFDLDIETQQRSNELIGTCGSFVSSPDLKHIAHLDTVAPGPADNRADSVIIDDDAVAYRGHQVQVVGELVWSEDSRKIAFLERSILNGKAGLTVLSLDGRAGTTQIPDRILRDAVIAWRGSEIVVAGEQDTLLIDHRRRTASAATRGAASTAERARRFQRLADEQREELRRLAVRFQAREAVAWSR